MATTSQFLRQIRGRMRNPIQQAPQKYSDFFREQLPGLESLFRPDAGILESIRQRSVGESGARQRAALLGLQARGGAIPGAYGTAALLSQLGSQSDLSRELGAANLAEQQRAKGFQQDYLQQLMALIGQQKAGEQAYQSQRALQAQQAKQNRKTAGDYFGDVLGAGAQVGAAYLGGLARGGVVDEPTSAIVGEDGPEAVIPMNGLSPAEQDTLMRLLGKARLAQETGVGGLRPFQEPADYEPQGFLERLGAGSPLSVTSNAPPLVQLLQAIGMTAQGLGRRRLKQGQATRGRSQAFVKQLNEPILAERQSYATTLGRERAEAEFPKPENPLTMAREERAQRAEERAIAASERAAKAAEIQARGTESTTADRLFNNAANDPDIKNYPGIRDSYETGRSAAQLKSSLGDMVLMRMIAKATDPSTGVREEEFRTFESAQGILARLGVRLTKDMWGQGKLTEPGRAQMLEQLKGIHDRKLRASEQAGKFYQKQASQFGVDPSLILRGYRGEQAQVEGETPAAPVAPAGRPKRSLIELVRPVRP